MKLFLTGIIVEIGLIGFGVGVIYSFARRFSRKENKNMTLFLTEIIGLGIGLIGWGIGIIYSLIF